MGDSFEMVVDVDVSVEDAEAKAKDVLEHLTSIGLIASEPTDDCVLSGLGHRPGEFISTLYKLEPGELPFWELVTCGVESNAERNFNFWAVGPAFEGLTCPSCGSTVVRPEESFMDAVGRAIGAWCKETTEPEVTCPNCSAGHSITRWVCRPPLGFGNLSFTFWNWPSLDSIAWRIDILGSISAATGHRLVHTFGRL